MSRQPPKQNPPPVVKIQLRYSKTGRMRFASHRDFARVFERALRRAEIPMAYSSGFSPHPRISYLNAAPTGTSSTAEYVEIGLASVLEPEKVAELLNRQLPGGFVIESARVSPAKKLAEELVASEWLVTGLPEGVVEPFLACESVLVERVTKSGPREFEVRSAVVSCVLVSAGWHLTLHHTVPLVRPDDVVSAMRQISPTANYDSVLFSREKQGILADGSVQNPW